MLTKKTEYALVAACHLANAGENVVSAREIAERYDIRTPLMMNVLKLLNRHGLVKSIRGARGGYALAVPASEITLSKLIEVVEGRPKLVRCASAGPDDPGCDASSSCPVRRPLVKIHGRFSEFLEGVTVADVAFDELYHGETFSRPVVHQPKAIAQ